MKLVSGLFAAALSAFAFASANAADMYPPEGGSFKDSPGDVPVNTWAGFYVGGNGGYAWNASNSTVSSTVIMTGHVVDPVADLSPSGGFGGGQIGYNWQRNRFVYGIEADIQGASLSDSGTATAFAPLQPNNSNIPGTSIVSAESNLDWFGTIRARLGYTYGNALIYATGGLAFGGIEDKLSATALGVIKYHHADIKTVSAKSDDTATGFVIGGGVEYALSPAWSVKAEYQYIDLGSEDLGSSAFLKKSVGDETVTGVGKLNVDNAFHTVRIGLNYHIGQSFEPLK